MFLVENENEFLDKYGKMAYKVAGKFVIEGYHDIEREDINQLALLYLWEATKSYDETKGVSFITYAYIYIYNNLANYFTKKNLKKNKVDTERVELTGLTDNETDGYETILEAPGNDENSISYYNLRIDIEMQLQKLKKQSKNTKAQTIFKGVHILEGLLKGEEPEEIKARMKMSNSVYKKCLYCARDALKGFMA